MLIGRKMVVVGGGIGGLAAALALAMRGAQVEVIEQAGELREVGAGLQISPNGMAVLHALGVAGALRSLSVEARAVHLREHRTGGAVTSLDLRRLSDAGPWLLVHRGDLIDILAEAASDAGVFIRLDSRVAGVKNAVEGAHVDLENGDRIEADLVVGADGVRSVVRPFVDQGPAATFTGWAAWRALVPVEHPLAPEVSVHMGPGRHLVCYPLRDRKLLNVVAVVERADWVPEGWNHADDPESLRQAFSGFNPEVRQILDRVRDVRLWGLFRHPVAYPWQVGRIALLGDAAHPTLPFLAQGACMALEDAWILADSLSAADSVGAGLAAYQSARRERCVRIVDAANFNATAYHLNIGPVRALAHTGLRIGGRIFPGAALSRFDWLYRHDVTRPVSGC